MEQNFSVDALMSFELFAINNENEIINCLNSILSSVYKISTYIKISEDNQIINQYSEIESILKENISLIESNMNFILENLNSYIFEERDSTDSCSYALNESIDEIQKKINIIKNIDI